MNAPARRFRSLPHRRPFMAAALWLLLHTLSVLAVLTILVITIIYRNPQTVGALILALAAMVITWFIALIFRRDAKCPLCRGTPLWDNGNAEHAKATRIRPFNHGYSSALELITTRKFRCKDCGTSYDLMKKSNRFKN